MAQPLREPVTGLTETFGPPQGVRITFAKRVFVGQRIELRHTDREFEVCDRPGALLAFGDFDALAPSPSR